jgi:glycosyltransferase involved in cell wall biosynthesis
MSERVKNTKSITGARRTVAFVESAGAMGGVQFSTLYLAQRLNRREWNPIVICPEEGDLHWECRSSGVEARVLPPVSMRSTSIRVGKRLRLPNPAAWIWNGFALRRAARRLKSVLMQNRPALVVTKGLTAHFYGAVAARRLGIPCVWHAQDLISERSFGIYRKAFGLAARWLPKQIIVDGASIARQLPASLQSRVTVILNGVDTDMFHPQIDGGPVRQELGIPKDDLVIGHLARLTPWKGQHYLIEAFARIADKHPNASLLLVGAPLFDNDSYQRKLKGLVAQLGLESRVRFAGYRHDTPQVLAAMDVFGFTSIEKDTSPLALLSAMSCGLPIVAFDIAGVREVMSNDNDVRLAPVEDIEALSIALSDVIADPKLRRDLGTAARRLALSEFSIDKCAEKIEEVFRIALEGPSVANANRVLPRVQQSVAS